MTKQKIIYLVILALVIIFSLVGWFTLKGILFNGSATAGVSIVASIFLLAAVALGLIAVLFDNLGLMVLAPALGCASFFLFFGVKTAYLIVFAIGIILIFFAASRALAEKRAHMKISLSPIVRPSLGALFTALALIISAVIYFSPPAQDINVELKVPRPLFDLILDSMTSVTPSSLFSASQVLDKQSQGKLYEMINSQINFFFLPYKRYLPYGLAVATFLTLKAASIILVWLAIIIIRGIFVLMKKFNMVNIKKEMVEKEVVEII